MNPVRIALAAALTLLASAALAQTPRYSLTDIGVLPGRTGSVAHAINASGQVAGYSFSGSAGQFGHGFLWTPAPGGGSGTLVELAPLTGGDQAHGMGLDDAGRVVGHSNTDKAPPRAVLWSGGAPVELFLGNGNANVLGVDINASGLMCGYMTGSGSGNPAKFRAVLWTEDPNHPGRYDTTVLGVLPGGDTLQSFGVASGINDAGQVVGWSFLADGTGNHAVIWENDATHTVTDLPFPAGAGGVIANAINQAGEAVGEQFVPAAWDRAVKWGPAPAHTPVDLGVLPGRNASDANGIDDVGDVVGMSYVFDPAVGGSDPHGFIWRDGVMRDLNDLLDASGAGWVVTNAVAINDAGWIAGSATAPSGQTRAVVLAPSEPIAAVAPSAAREVALSAWPNPARGPVDVRFSLSRGARTRIAVYDIHGRRVAELADGAFSAGTHAVRWDGRDAAGQPVAPGLYLVRAASGAEATQAKVVIER
jgi:probable HAF family extracellular repeat protein